MGLHPRSEIVKGDGWPDASIARVAERQQTIITRPQLLALGISKRAVTRAVDRQRLHRVHRGVYSLVPRRARPPRAGEWAATLAYGSSSVLSHHTAAKFHGLPVPGPPPPIHLTVGGRGRKSSHRGIVLHRTIILAPSEHHRLDGLPVTSVARTVIDLSPHLTDRQREVLVDQALHKTSHAKLAAALARHAGRPGVPALGALLDPARPSSITWSQAEERLLRLIRRAGLPAPECNIPLTARYTPDLLWREQRVIVEYESDEWHSGSRSTLRDDARHNDLTTDGYQLLHMTKGDVPEQILVWIARALALAGWTVN